MKGKQGTAITDDQLHMLRHMLGINTPYDAVPRPYRNYAAVTPGDGRFLELEKMGLVECYRRAGNGCRSDFYQCTEAGKLAAMRSHKTIRVHKKARVYHAYMDIRDCFPDLTFHEFLTSGQFAETRKNA